MRNKVSKYQLGSLIDFIFEPLAQKAVTLQKFKKAKTNDEKIKIKKEEISQRPSLQIGRYLEKPIRLLGKGIDYAGRKINLALDNPIGRKIDYAIDNPSFIKKQAYKIQEAASPNYKRTPVIGRKISNYGLDLVKTTNDEELLDSYYNAAAIKEIMYNDPEYLKKLNRSLKKRHGITNPYLKEWKAPIVVRGGSILGGSAVSLPRVLPVSLFKQFYKYTSPAYNIIPGGYLILKAGNALLNKIPDDLILIDPNIIASNSELSNPKYHYTPDENTTTFGHEGTHSFDYPVSDYVTKETGIRSTYLGPARAVSPSSLFGGYVVAPSHSGTMYDLYEGYTPKRNFDLKLQQLAQRNRNNVSYEMDTHNEYPAEEYAELGAIRSDLYRYGIIKSPALYVRPKDLIKLYNKIYIKRNNRVGMEAVDLFTNKPYINNLANLLNTVY